MQRNLKYLTFRQTGDRLVISEKSFGNRNYEGAKLVICIPEGAVLKEIDIFAGAGKFTADVLSAEKLELEFGAGEVNIGELNATREADINGGAGQITVGGGSLCDLQLDMGVGKLDLTTKIVGEGEMNLGVGEVTIRLNGGLDSYTVEMTKGIGDLTFNGEKLSVGKTVGGGATEVEINGGVGSINVIIE